MKDHIRLPNQIAYAIVSDKFDPQNIYKTRQQAHKWKKKGDKVLKIQITFLDAYYI